MASKIKVNFTKAKEITKERLRIEREPLLRQLDVDYILALEKGRPVDAIVSSKQNLRDITKLADSATTLEELKGLTAKK